MAFLSKLFGSKEKNMEELLTSLKESQKKKDFVTVCRLYYEIGVRYREEGNHLKARLYLNRFDTLASSQDDIYAKINEKWMDDVSNWIDEYDADDSFYTNQIRDHVEELSASLSGRQKLQWNLLTMARFDTLFKRMSTLPGLEFMTKYKKALTIFAQNLYRPIDQSEYDFISDFLRDFYPFTDSLALADTANRLPIAGGAAFECYDLVGGSTLLCIYELLADLTELTELKRESSQVHTDIVTTTLLADYYVRTKKGDIRSLPAVKAEESRILDDYRFVSGKPDKEQFFTRFDSYRKISLPV